MQVDLALAQGETFVRQFYWYDGDPVIKPITAVAETFPSGYPARLSVAAHGLPNNDTPARVIGAKGATAINTATDPADPDYTRYARRIDADTCDLLGVYTTGGRPYTGGGFLQYVPPKNLAGWKARMHVRKTVNAADPPLLIFDTETNGGLAISSAEGLTTLTVAADVTPALTWRSAVYQLELYQEGSPEVVKRLAFGAFTIDPEATR